MVQRAVGWRTGKEWAPREGVPEARSGEGEGEVGGKGAEGGGLDHRAKRGMLRVRTREGGVQWPTVVRERERWVGGVLRWSTRWWVGTHGQEGGPSGADEEGWVVQGWSEGAQW